MPIGKYWILLYMLQDHSLYPDLRSRKQVFQLQYSCNRAQQRITNCIDSPVPAYSPGASNVVRTDVVYNSLKHMLYLGRQDIQQLMVPPCSERFCDIADLSSQCFQAERGPTQPSSLGGCIEHGLHRRICIKMRRFNRLLYKGLHRHIP